MTEIVLGQDCSLFVVPATTGVGTIKAYIMFGKNVNGQRMKFDCLNLLPLLDVPGGDISDFWVGARFSVTDNGDGTFKYHFEFSMVRNEYLGSPAYVDTLPSNVIKKCRFMVTVADEDAFTLVAILREIKDELDKVGDFVAGQ